MNLITGTSGNLGKVAAELYLQQNTDQPLAVLSRSAAKVKDLTDKGAELRIGDYGDYASLVKAFAGIEKILFVSSNDLENRELHHKNVIKAAKEAGVKQLLFTSFQYTSTAADSPNGLMPVYVASENFLKDSGLDYVILRNGIYMNLLLDIIGTEIRSNKTLFAPAGDTQVAFTSRNDLAEAAVKVLLSEDYSRQTIDLTNAETVNFPQIAHILSDIIDADVKFVDPSSAEYQQALAAAGLPAAVVGLFAGIIASIKAGEFSKTTGDLQHILGRKPQTVAEFLQTNIQHN